MKYYLRSIGIAAGSGSFRGVCDLSSVDLSTLYEGQEDDYNQLAFLFSVLKARLLTALAEGKRITLFDTFVVEPTLTGSVKTSLDDFTSENLEIKVKVKSAYSAALQGRATLVKDNTPPVGPYVKAVISGYFAENFIGFPTFNVIGGGFKASGYAVRLEGAGEIFDVTPYVVKVTDSRIVAKLPNLAVVSSELQSLISDGHCQMVVSIAGNELAPFPCELGILSAYTPELNDRPLLKVHGGFTHGGLEYDMITRRPVLELSFTQLDDDSGRFVCSCKVGGVDEIASLTDYLASYTVSETGLYRLSLPFVDPLPSGYTLPVDVGSGIFVHLAIPRVLWGQGAELKGQVFSALIP